MAKLPRPEEIEPQIGPYPTTASEAESFLRLHASVTSSWNSDVNDVKVVIKGFDQEDEQYVFTRKIETSPGDPMTIAKARMIRLAQQGWKFLKRAWDGTLLDDGDE